LKRFSGPVSLETFFGTYGYPALLVGTFFEGETFLVLAGFAASLGYLEIPWVILVAFAGTLCGDQVFFYLGRRHSVLVQPFLACYPAWQNRVERVHRLIERHQTALVFLFHFLYGLRIAFLLVIGLSRIPAGRFFALNVLSALVWAVVVGMGGYLFGSALVLIVGNLKDLENYILAGIALVGAMFGILQILGYRIMKSTRAKRLER
jgi:membrane protein DedA with SNARE-associated domain